MQSFPTHRTDLASGIEAITWLTSLSGFRPAFERDPSLLTCLAYLISLAVTRDNGGYLYLPFSASYFAYPRLDWSWDPLPQPLHSPLHSPLHQTYYSPFSFLELCWLDFPPIPKGLRTPHPCTNSPLAPIQEQSYQCCTSCYGSLSNILSP